MVLEVPNGRHLLCHCWRQHWLNDLDKIAASRTKLVGVGRTMDYTVTFVRTLSKE